MLFILPNHTSAMKIDDYKPIALSNAMYLIVAKTLANHLSKTQNDLAHPMQAAFIVGRSIIDSYIMAPEIIKAWCHTDKQGSYERLTFLKLIIQCRGVSCGTHSGCEASPYLDILDDMHIIHGFLLGIGER